ncbi:glycoside hydrolase family 1 protein [Flavobacterium agrisoli]|uniref:Glycoside hydrolase family 1 protein n=1 Tax=Flavobacterium agrisoli TaxID=2793066 RepID=A0A934PKC8_9FLAO|nr:glycoside hydrolase family 1 protein [Flavobacterium agrisoli]MBK0368345.1 glycoside hydrolase family 1 protein [Flavobacterium agrisoli]
MLKKLLVACTAIFLLYFFSIAYFNYKHPIFKWNWETIPTSEMHFPKTFLWGTATAAHQVEGGHTNSNWSWWENQKKKSGQPTIANQEKAGIATNHWQLYPKDITLMQELGVNSYRFSLSWSKINPKEGHFDQASIEHYSNVIDSLLAKNIVPNITLHHFEEPLWFMQKGGFEKMENLRYFELFVKKMIQSYGNRVQLWTTFNEINVYTSLAYMSDIFPPGKDNTLLAGQVLRNILIAHTRVYQMIKKLPEGKNAKIGIVKDIFFFEPKNRWNVLDWLGAEIADSNFNSSSLAFFETGKYQFYVPFEANLQYEDKNAPNTLDFIGLNYYSHYATEFKLFEHEKMFSAVKDETMTDMDYTVYPEGIYRAIKRISKLQKPILITETGIADNKDDRRPQFIERELFAVSKAIQDGYDVRGYYYWSLIDNFEWSLGYSKKFGLYSVDQKTQIRTLKNGGKTYQKIVKKFAQPQPKIFD